MNFRGLDKDKKYFVFVGIPCLVFLSFIFLTHYIQISIFFLLIMGIFTGGLLGKKRFLLRLTKVGFATTFIFLIMFYNVTQFPSQFARRLPGGRNDLIEPNHDKVKEFKEDFYDWHLDQYGVDFKDMNETNREDLKLKMERFDHYVREVRMKYSYDVNPPYYFYDHLPTIDEIFESDIDDDGKLQDDCDGMTILSVSVLISMGYDAWVAETEYHYYTIIFPEGEDPKTEKGYEERIYIYNSQDKPAYMLFNDKETFIPPSRPLHMSVLEIIFGATMWDNYFLGFFTGKYFRLNSAVVLILTVILCILIGYILTFYAKVGTSLKELDKKVRRKKFFKIAVINGFICSLTVLILFWFSISGLAAFGNLILMAGLITAFRYADLKIKKILD